MSAGMVWNVTQDRPDVAKRSLTRAALWVLFVGEGWAISVPYFANRFPGLLPEWLVSRYSLLAALPALLISLPDYAASRGIVKSVPFLAWLGWMTISLLWVDPTEIGRGMVVLASLAITVPTATLIARTGLKNTGSLWFGAALIGSLLLATLTGMESIGGRFGDVEEGNVVVMNSNSVGMATALILLLMYRLYEQRSRAAPARRIRPQPGAVR